MVSKNYFSFPYSCEFKVKAVEKAEEYIINDERLCSFIDDDDCRATFVYGYNYTNGVLQVWVQNTKVKQTFSSFYKTFLCVHFFLTRPMLRSPRSSTRK